MNFYTAVRHNHQKSIAFVCGGKAHYFRAAVCPHSHRCMPDNDGVPYERILHGCMKHYQVQFSLVYPWLSQVSANSITSI